MFGFFLIALAKISADRMNKYGDKGQPFVVVVVFFLFFFFLDLM